jgi:hypothetical protein
VLRDHWMGLGGWVTTQYSDAGEQIPHAKGPLTCHKCILYLGNVTNDDLHDHTHLFGLLRVLQLKWKFETLNVPFQWFKHPRCTADGPRQVPPRPVLSMSPGRVHTLSCTRINKY